MNIVFKKLKIRNFLSIGSIDLNFTNQNNIVFITGYNRDQNSKNGAGKSSILEALHYAVVGEPYRSIKKANIINKNSNDASYVELTFNIGNDEYEIFRGLKPNKMSFKVNGIDKTRTVPETNADIIKIINIDKMMFQNTLILSNDNSIPFLERTSSEKVKFVESILSLSNFDRLFDVARNGLNQAKKAKDILDAKRTIIENDLIKFKGLASSFDDIKNKTISEYQNKIEDLERIVNDIDIEDLDLEKYRNSEEKNKSNIALGERKLMEVELNHKSTLKEMVHLKNNTACPTCKREYDDKQSKLDKISQLEKEVEKFNSQIEEYKGKLKILYDRKKALNDYKKKIDANQEKRSRVVYLNEQIDNFKRNIAIETARENSYLSLVSDKKTEFDSLSVEFNHVNDEYLIYDKLKYVYSPDGVKSAIIKKIINLFNDLLEDYLIKLNAPCSIVFNELFEDKVLDFNKNEITYYSLSSGERKRVDLALLFAFKELRRLQSNVSCNVSFFDEVFDSSLDDTGMQCCLRIIEELSVKYSEKYFIITHRSEQVDTNKFDVLRIEKINGISHLI